MNAMGRQRTFASEAWIRKIRKGGVTRRERFLALIVPCSHPDSGVGQRTPGGNKALSQPWRKIHQARSPTMFALADLYALRHRLLPPGATCTL